MVETEVTRPLNERNHRYKSEGMNSKDRRDLRVALDGHRFRIKVYDGGSNWGRKDERCVRCRISRNW